jgi:hypothetical protein
MTISLLLTLFVSALPANASGQESSSGMPIHHDPIPGEKFHYDCQLYAVKSEDVMAVSKVMPLTNDRYNLVAQKWEKFGVAGGLPGEFVLEEGNVEPFPASKNNTVTLIKRQGSSKYFLYLRLLDESKLPVATYNSLVAVDLRSPRIQAEISTSGNYETNFTLGVTCEKK